MVITKLQNESFQLVTERRHDIGVLCAVSHIFAYWTSCHVPSVIFFIVECGITWFFSVLCTYSKFGHHPHPLGYLCAKFRFRHGPHCWVSRGEKSHTQSLSHSLTQLNWCPKNRSSHFWRSSWQVTCWYSALTVTEDSWRIHQQQHQQQ